MENNTGHWLRRSLTSEVLPLSTLLETSYIA